MTGTHVPTALRRQVESRAQGCCEYCLVPSIVSLVPHQVDHIVAQKHGGQTEGSNLALSCAIRNKHKGTDLVSVDPETLALVPLCHPRQHKWPEHFRLNNAAIEPLTAIGRVTVRLLQLNRPERLAERDLLIEVGLLHQPRYAGGES